MKEAFRDKVGLNKANKIKLDEINEIIEEYVDEGYKLTLRQLYYQLVSRDMIPNRVSEYAKLSTLLVKGRMAGIVDWEAIEDRIRIPKIPYWVLGIDHALEDTINQYRLDRLGNQEIYIELWVEKDALSGVLSRVTNYYHVKLMVNRGYSSATAMYDASKRFLYNENNGKDGYLFYLGDHDPSGLDMIRDIRERLHEFGVFPKVIHIGLTWEQIEEYNPPPNPTKITDPRSSWYIGEHGNMSWEVDALPPNVLDTLVRETIEKEIDMKLFEGMLRQEKADKKILQGYIENK